MVTYDSIGMKITLYYPEGDQYVAQHVPYTDCSQQKKVLKNGSLINGTHPPLTQHTSQ